MLAEDAGAPAAEPPADEAAASADRDVEARRLYVAGDAKYAEGDYAAAVELFSRSYELSGRPALQFNLANAFERLGRLNEALAALRRFEPHSTGEQKLVVQKRIEQLEARIAARAAPPRSAATAAPTPPGPESGEAAAATPPSTAPNVSEKNPPVAGYSLLGVGVLGLALGAGFGVKALRARDSVESLCVKVDSARRCPDGARGDLDDDQRNSIIADVSFAVGVAAAAVGVYLVVKSSRDEKRRAVVGASALPGGARMTLGGHF